MTKRIDYRVSAARALQSECEVPGDKSISHRSIMFSAIADGQSRVEKLLEGEDVLATIRVFRQLGVTIERVAEGCYQVDGVGLNGLRATEELLDLGNSGTAMRLLAGLLCGIKGQSTLTGDDSLTSRPMGRVIKPLAQMGAVIDSDDGRPPLTINANQPLTAIEYTLPVASAQVKSCVLLAGLYAQGKTTVIENGVTRDHTERMLQGFGYPVDVSENRITIVGGQSLSPQHIVVPGDISSAAFLIVAALIVPESDLLIKGVGVNPTRDGIVRILKRMGAQIEFTNERQVGVEPVADIRVRYSTLKGIEITAEDVHLAIDELPIIAVAAACADGATRVSGAEELRVKESDRIASVVAGMQAIGVDIKEYQDGFSINGGVIKGGIVESHHDHRISMAFTIAGFVSESGITVRGCDNVVTSFPGFVSLMHEIGASVTEQHIA